jgi:hypothetical protein
MAAHHLLVDHLETPVRAYGILMVYYTHKYVRTRDLRTYGGFFLTLLPQVLQY